MLIKYKNHFLEIPFDVTMEQFSSKKELFTNIVRISTHLKDCWGTSGKKQRPFDFDYGFEFVKKAILESQSNDYINNCIHDYLIQKKDSIRPIEIFIKLLIERMDETVLFEQTILLIHDTLLKIYDGPDDIVEERYLDSISIKIWCEHVMFLLVKLIKPKLYFSTGELVYKYNNLFFPYFFDQTYRIQNNKNDVSERLISNQISRLKSDKVFDENEIVEFRNNKVLKNFISREVIAYIEQHSNKIKSLMSNYTFYSKINDEVFDKSEQFITEIENDYKYHLNNENPEVYKVLKKMLVSFANEKLKIVYKINTLNLIVEDILSYDTISYDFETYENIFSMKYNQILLYKEKELREVYFRVLSFILLYAHRIRLGKIPYNLFQYLCNTYPEYKEYMEQAKLIFKGTKGHTIFSKVFYKFVSQQILPDFENQLKSKSHWMNIEDFIKKHLKGGARQDVVYENLKSTNRKINKYISFIDTAFQKIVDRANDNIVQLKDKNIEVGSYITEPPREGELNPDNTLVLGNFDRNGNKEFAKIEKGEYTEVNIEQQKSLFLQEQTYMLRNFFENKKYIYTVVGSDNQFSQGIIYFYDLDEANGRYKTFDNIKIEKEEIISNTRYGRFSVDLISRTLVFTQNGSDNLIGKYPMQLLNLKFNWEDDSIKSEVYHQYRGSIVVQFKRVE